MTDNLTLQQANTIPGFNSKEGYQLLWSMSKMFSETTLVPEHFRKNIGNCAIAINMANRMGADPLMVMQNMYIVYGNPAWSSKFLIATFNQCGKYSSVKYRYVGTKNQDDYGCIAYTTELATGEKIEGPLVTIGLAKAEGWFAKKGSKWQTIPDLMLRYRAATWLIRTTAPELSMGLQTQEEIYDTQEKDVTPVDKPIEEINGKMASRTLNIDKEDKENKDKGTIEYKKPTVLKASTKVLKEKEIINKPVEKPMEMELPEEPEF